MQPVSFEAMSSLDDNTLLSMGSQGNHDAISVLVLRYLWLVRKRASRFQLNGMDSDDVAQEGVIGLMDAIRTYRSDRGSSFFTYASVCVDHRIQKAAVRANNGKNRAFAASLPLDEVDQSSALVDGDQNPERILIEKESLQRLQEKIDALLSSFERDVLFFYLQGCNYDQMANKLHTSHKAIDNALQRIRRKLRLVLR